MKNYLYVVLMSLLVSSCLSYPVMATGKDTLNRLGYGRTVITNDYPRIHSLGSGKLRIWYDKLTHQDYITPGIATPSMVTPSCDQEYDWAVEIKAFTNNILAKATRIEVLCAKNKKGVNIKDSYSNWACITLINREKLTTIWGKRGMIAPRVLGLGIIPPNYCKGVL